ncbi:hypothetical protein GCM10027275_05580 [Rhabdobacter roseus]|uniref:Ligand-binding sensor domain-containing protein n=1 Tax=Rhabdobacter roseus TaxID=1655419 RepID=A0A840TR28_9BACT|nr:two-component regulator propeller domain-containing protein [Rhabdobacter roseus]MBB5282448.1 ligand-binding sensor domain-containing protein [Rhabdobacter roseus]
MKANVSALILRQALVLVLLVVSRQGYAQPREFKVTQYNEAQGLESRTIRCMLQDSRDLLWLGTVEGLSCFDGYTFKMFHKKAGDKNSLTSNFITALAEDHNGLLWIGYLQGGVSSYDPATGTFRSYLLRTEQNRQLPAREITTLFVDQDNDLWIGLQREGLLRLNQKTGQCTSYSLAPPEAPANDPSRLYNTVYGAVETEPGYFWLATANGLYQFIKKTSTLRQVPFPKALQKDVRVDLFTSIKREGDNLWLGAWAGGLSRYGMASGRWDNYLPTPNNSKSTTNIINGMSFEGKDTVWVISASDGFGYFLKSSASFHFFGKKTDLAPRDYRALMPDKQGNLWLAYNQGLLKVRMEKKKFVFHKVPVSRSDNGEHYRLSKIFENDQYLLTGTVYADGLHLLDKRSGQKKILSFEADLGEPFLLVEDILQDRRGTIWVLTRDYLYHLDQQRQVLVKIPQPPLAAGLAGPSNFFERMREDIHGRVWIVTGANGVFCYDPTTQRYTHYASSQKGKFYLPISHLRAITLDQQGRIWIGGSYGYLAYFDAATEKFVTLAADQLGEAAGSHVLALLTDRAGKVWAGTYAGLLCYEANRKSPAFKFLYTSENGLRGDITEELCEDASGRIWCITIAALCVVNPANRTVVSFGVNDGIEHSNVGDRLTLTPRLTMKLSLSQGYYEFDPSFLERQLTRVPVRITSMQVNDQERYFMNEVRRQEPVKLGADENSLSFTFAALDYNEPEKQRYLYQLEGFDENWVPAGRRRYASYTNLPGGHYVFRVKATSVDEEWGQADTSVPLYIATVFYQLWWFRVLVLGLCMGVVYLIYRTRLRQEERIYSLQSKAQSLEKEKALVMYESLKQQLNPHFLFNSLTSLNSLIRIDQKTAGEFLESLSKTYRYILKSRDNDLVPLENEIQFARTYIKLQKTRFGRGLQINIAINEEYNHWKVAPVILQNMLENAIKHNRVDEETPLVVDIFTENDQLVIRNNLQKKNFVETSNRQGLANLESLYRYLSERPLEICEEKHYFTVKVPLI